MEKMKLEDLIPMDPTFTIKSTGKTYRIRPPNMQDQVWFKTRYGSEDGYSKAVKSEDWNEIAVVVYYLLSQEDKRDFLPEKVKILDEMGAEKEVHHTGPEMLLVSLSGISEMLVVMQALTRAIFISNPIAEEIAKKKLAETGESPVPLPASTRRTGPKLSTSSRVSTDKARRRSRS